eukprot:4832754-Amphidinium_carterae.1
MEAVVERVAWLLYPKFVHYSFTTVVFRAIAVRHSTKRRMTLRSANVLLTYTWLVVLLCGPCLPILSALVALLAKIHSVLLFGSDLNLLDMDEHQTTCGSVQGFGFSGAAVFSLVMQCGSLLCPQGRQL